MPWFSPATARRSTEQTRHPYYPHDVPLPHYQPNSTPLPLLLGSFGSLLAVIVTSSLLLATRARRGLTRSDQALIGWFVLCLSPTCVQGTTRESAVLQDCRLMALVGGALHCVFEGRADRPRNAKSVFLTEMAG